MTAVSVYSVKQSGERLFSTVNTQLADAYSRAGFEVTAVTQRRQTA